MEVCCVSAAVGAACRFELGDRDFTERPRATEARVSRVGGGAMRLVKGLGQKTPGTELSTAMCSVCDDDVGDSFYCRLVLNAMQAGSGSEHARREGESSAVPRNVLGPPRNGTRVLSITWIDTVRITASRFGSCVGNLYAEGKGVKGNRRGMIRFYLSDPEPAKIRFMICSLYRNRI